MKINIRIATKENDDVNGIYNSGKNSLPIYYEPEAILSFIKSAKHLIIISKVCNIIIGHLIVKFTKTNVHILSIGVIQGYRKLGVASNMLKYLEKIIKLYDSIKTLSLNVHVENDVAISFYKKHGFIISKRICDYYVSIPYNKSLDSNLMIKKLD